MVRQLFFVSVILFTENFSWVELGKLSREFIPSAKRDQIVQHLQVQLERNYDYNYNRINYLPVIRYVVEELSPFLIKSESETTLNFNIILIAVTIVFMVLSSFAVCWIRRKINTKPEIRNHKKTPLDESSPIVNN